MYSPYIPVEVSKVVTWNQTHRWECCPASQHAKSAIIHIHSGVYGSLANSQGGYEYLIHSPLVT
jgi:hypothetical protein